MSIYTFPCARRITEQIRAPWATRRPHHPTFVSSMTVATAADSALLRLTPEDLPGSRYSGEASGGPPEGTRQESPGSTPRSVSRR